MKFRAIVVDIGGAIICEKREFQIGNIKKICFLKVSVALATEGILWRILINSQVLSHAYKCYMNNS